MNGCQTIMYDHIQMHLFDNGFKVNLSNVLNERCQTIMYDHIQIHLFDSFNELLIFE